MKTRYGSLAALLGAGVCALVLTAGARAQCLGVAPAPQNHQQTSGHARLIPAAYGGGQLGLFGLEPPVSPIVGLWHVKLVATDPALGEIDAGYSEWHSDGTEILNSGGRAPATGSFCLGVWTQTGPRTFKLNHFAISWADAADRQGPTQIVEEVTVSPNGESFSGTFTLTDYTETDNSNPATNSITVKDQLKGTVSGTRITVNTQPSPIF